jgi:polyferredoxin/spermidine synthase
VPRQTERTLVALAALAAGVQALLAQSLLIREELLLYGGNEIAVGAFLGLWLIGVAVGALAIRRRAALAGRLALPLLLVQGALPLAAVALARMARGMSGIPPYEPFPLTLLLLWSVPVAVPVSLTTGALVPALAARARRFGGSVTGVFVAESVGSLVGGVGATLLLAAGVESMVLVLACGLVGALGATALARGPARPALGAVALGLAALALVAGPPLGRHLRAQHLHTALPGAALLDYAETAASALTLAELGGQQVLMVDGQVRAAFPDPERVERAAGLMAAVTGGPKRLLVVGSEAVDLLPGVLALDALERVLWVTADAGLRDFALRHVPGLSGDARLDVLAGDPIRHRETLAERGPFDAVWLIVDTPLRRSDDRFVTRETLRALADLLDERGVLAVPVRGAENYVGPRLRLAVGTMVAGMAQALAEVRLIPGDDGLVLGARTPAELDLDPTRLAATYAAMKPARPRIGRDGFQSLLDARRIERADSLVESLRRDPAVTASELDRPLALFHNLLVRAEQESAALARLLETLRRTGGVLWVPLLVLALFPLAGIAFRRRPAESSGAAALAVVAAGGAIGMGLDLLLLHLYQGRFGTLYLEVGWLFGLWMGGLALGGALGRRLCSRASPFAVGLSALASLALMAALIAVGGSGLLLARAVGAAVFVVAGALSGAVIPVAEELLASAGVVGGRAGAGIEAADHLGGALCALGLGVLAIPVVGLGHSAWLMAGLTAFAAASLAIALVRQRELLPARLHRWLASAALYESFPYRRTMLALGSLGAAAVVGHAVVQQVLLGPSIRLDDAVLAASGLSAPWVEATDPCIHYRSQMAGDRGLALASRAAAPRVQGYGGPLNLLVATDGSGHLRHLSLLEHDETPSYVEDIGAFFEGLEGMSILERIEVRLAVPGADRSDAERSGVSREQTVDAITGATITSRAVVQALEQTGRRLAEPIFGRRFSGRQRAPSLGEPRYLYMAAALLLLLPVFLFGGRRLRRLWLTLHAALGGVWLGVQLSTVQILAWLRLEPEMQLLTWTGLLVAVVALAALVGPLYCGYLCPAGALQELLGHLGLARRMPPEIDQRARFAKYALLTAVVVGSLAFGSQSVLHLDLLREVWAEKRSGHGVLLLGLVAGGSLFTLRFGCRYLCPTGAFLNLLSKVAPLRRLLPAKLYPLCDLGIRGAPDVDCLQCNRCRIGERVRPASEPRVRAFHAALAGSLLLLVVFALPAGRGVEVTRSAGPQIRPVDLSLLRMKIEAGHLSDKRAQYWHVVRPAEREAAAFRRETPSEER